MEFFFSFLSFFFLSFYFFLSWRFRCLLWTNTSRFSFCFVLLQRVNVAFRQSLALAELAFQVGFITQLRRSADRSPMEVAKEMLIASRRSPLVFEDVAEVCTQLLYIKIVLEILDFASKLEICSGGIFFHFIDLSMRVSPPLPLLPPSLFCSPHHLFLGPLSLCQPPE